MHCFWVRRVPSLWRPRALAPNLPDARDSKSSSNSIMNGFMWHQVDGAAADTLEDALEVGSCQVSFLDGTSRNMSQHDGVLACRVKRRFWNKAGRVASRLPTHPALIIE